MTIQSLFADPRFEHKKVIEKLLCATYGWTKEELFVRFDQDVTPEVLSRIETDYFAYKTDQKPLEYVLWFVEFFGLRFKVDQNTLIPRPETEYMIQAVDERCLEHPWQKVLLDVGTGCGVLWVSVIKHNPGVFDQRIFTDIADETLEVAKTNAITHLWNDHHINFLKGSVLNFLFDEQFRGLLSRPVLLVSNMPYIPEQTFDENVEINVKKWEPKIAFVWWDDGLLYYKQMLEQLLELRKIGLTTCVSFREMMTRQQEILEKEFWEYFNFEAKKTFHFNIIILKVDFR